MHRYLSCWVAAGLVLGVYLAALSVMPMGFFWSPDEGAKYIQLRSMRWEPGLAYEIPYAAVNTDPDFDFYPTRCRHEDLFPVRTDVGVRLHWPIWFSLLTSPFLSLLGTPGLYVIPLLGGWATALLAGFLVRGAGPLWMSATILLAGLGTPLFFYSLTYWEHTLATALAMGALCLAASSKGRNGWAWAPIALMLVAASMLRVEMMAFALALVCAWVVSERFERERPAPDRRPNLLWSALPLLLLAVVIGASLTSRHRWLFEVLPGFLLGNLQKLPALHEILAAVFINSPAEQGPIVDLGWALLALAAFATAAIAPFVRSRKLEAVLLVPSLAVAFEFSLLLAMRREPYISLHGVLPVAPYVVFAAWTIAQSWRERSRLVVATTAVAYLALGFGVVFTFLVKPDGQYKTGLEWGARYLLTLYPIAAVLCVTGLREIARSGRPPLFRRTVAALVVAMMLVGVQFQVRGVRMLYESRRLVETWQSELPLDRPVVTDIWWLAAAMAPFFTEHPMLCVRRPGALSPWLPAASQSGISGFTFASLREVDPAAFASPGFEIGGGEERIVSGLHLRPLRFTRSVHAESADVPATAARALP